MGMLGVAMARVVVAMAGVGLFAVVIQLLVVHAASLTPEAQRGQVVGAVTSGVVLDVRPIVSNDRKYVTLEMRPSLAELQTMRTVSIRPGLNILLQLPYVVLQKAETTVTCPDRGTIMITGFKDIQMKDMKSGVPFLEDIPVINFFFTRKAKVDERRRLFMLVTPEIIDLQERENQQF